MKPMGFAVTVFVALIGNPCPIFANTEAVSGARPRQPDIAKLDYALHARPIAARTWVIEGAVDDFGRHNGCNIINTAFIATGAGVIVINTGPSYQYGIQQRRLIERTTPEPVVRVLNLNLHPDYFFGNQAWLDRPVQALTGSISGMRAEGRAYADNLYRICGDWMKGTEPIPAREPVELGEFSLGEHRFELVRLEGHTADDLVLRDHSTGVIFAGGLVFADRVPTTPHADFERWRRSLALIEEWLASGHFQTVVPSHGPVHVGNRGVRQTLDWLDWLTTHMAANANAGRDLAEVLHLAPPDRFARWAAQPVELHRTLVQWYPRYEQKALTNAK